MGAYNVLSWAAGDRLIVGKGTESARANSFRVADSGTYATGSYNASGADYAELFEFSPGFALQEKDEYLGRFVTLQGDKIRLAEPEDEFILGVISATPSVVGDVYNDQWKGIYLTDVWGRNIIGEDGNPIVNPNYNPEEEYIPRTSRPEWATIGLLGKLIMLDDGSAQVDGYVACGPSGIATKSQNKTRFRVLRRIDENHIQILILC